MPRLQAILLSGAALMFAAGLPVLAQNAPSSNEAKPPAPQAKPAPANDNAFPEAESEAAEKEARAGDKAAADGPAAGPDSKGPDGAPPDSAVPESSSRSRMKGVDLLGDHDRHASNGAGGTVDNPELAKQDIRIGQLYMGDGNYPGAYARFKEATEVGPGNPEAVFYLAEAARKTAHLDEAATNYQLYLDADPKGKHGKDAKKALAQLAGK